MAAGDITVGRRVATMDDLELPGDYALGSVDDDGDVRPQIWFLLPIHHGATMYDHADEGSGLHGISSPPWTFRECPDGSIEVRASIACGHPVYWHGYLDEGHRWREV